MKTRILSTAIISLIATAALAEEPKIILNPTVVTATHTEENSFDVPVSIDVVTKESIQDAQVGMNLSESLIRVPGLTAQSRTSYSQDPQISTRGFGARSAFGVRGIRIFVDGIPLTMPDGIAQPGNIDLETIKAIEVMRGPFSTMYGSSSGGVIQMITDDAPKTPELKFNFMAGSYGMTKESTKLSGTQKNVQYMLDLSHFDTDGYRDHSAAWKDQATAQLKFNLDNGTRVNILADYFNSKAQDPLGLARNGGADQIKVLNSEGSFNRYTNTIDPSNLYYSVFKDPKTVPDVAILANTRVERTNTQIGTHIEHDLNNNNTLSFIGSIGNRDNLQYLAIPITCKAPSCNPSDGSTYDHTKGRASAINRDFWTSELSWTNRGEVFSKKYSVITGLNYGWMEDKRKDTNTSLGEMLPAANDTGLYHDPYGNINRNETDRAYNFDQFIQGQLALLNNFDLHGGLRHSQVDLKFTGNPEVAHYKDGAVWKPTDINGSSKFEKTTSAIGAVWKATPSMNFYANYGKGFETPTLIEMAYASSTAPSGPNSSLKPSTSDNYEVGVKTFIGNNTRLNLAAFKTDTKDEIIINANSTYTVYGNATKTKRQGFEASLSSSLGYNFDLYGAYTYLDATFDEAYTSGIKGGTNGQVSPGFKIPGTYKNQLYGEVSWRYPDLGFKTALEGRANSKVYINDVNSDFAPGYAIANIRAGFEQNISNWKFTEYTRIENIFDKNYIGSVRINDNNNRNFEAAPDRNYMVGVSATYRF